MSRERCMLFELRTERRQTRFPKSSNRPKGDGRLVWGGIAHVRQHSIFWIARRKRNGSFARIMTGLATGENETAMLDFLGSGPAGSLRA